jgi:peptidoglycan hydrolase-like protein with peptidoglycan-binding domain
MRFNPEPFGPELEFEGFHHNGGSSSEFEEEYRGRRGYARTPAGRFARYGMSPRTSLRQPTKPVAPRPAAAFRHGQGPLSKRHSHRRRRYSPGYAQWLRDPASPIDVSGVGPSRFVQWIQSSLNTALRLRLPVDGIMSASVRGAIRVFQERNGLPVTGSVDAQTESVLKQAGDSGGAVAPSGPAPLSAPAPADEPAAAAAPPADAGAGPGEFEAELDMYHPLTAFRRKAPAPSTLPQQAVQIARGEFARWKNGKMQETDPQAVPILQGYWKTGPGINYSTAQLASKTFQASHPWSAAFISWVMRKAGAAKDFRYSASHSNYIVAAKNNRLANNSNPFKAYRISEAAPEVGDLVCKSRAGSGATYDTIRSGMTTHCDIVTDVKPGSIAVIGGNVSQSVARKTVPTDSSGRITVRDYFAVIRVGRTGGIPVAPAPGPAPGPAPSSQPTPLPGVAVPTVLKQESTPPRTTLYAKIDLGITDRFGIKAAPITGIFVPDGFVSGPTVDIVLWLHGFKGDANRRLSIDQYWNADRFAYGGFREGVNASGRNVILIAPTLGSRSEAGDLLKPGGLDTYLAKVLGVLSKGVPSGLGNLILACHSGGGKPMRALAGGSDKALANLRECWGFDCTYNSGDDVFWAKWARSKPSARCYFYYIKNSPTARLSEALRDKRVPNAMVLPSKDNRHNYVPITHWRERLQGAGFLRARSGAGPVAPTPTPPGPPVPTGEPSDLKSLTHAQFIEFVGSRARKAMAATGVPASVTVAQAILETGWGKHTIGPAKNLFGIKGKGPAGSIRVPTREFVNGRWITVQANFAKYHSFEESVTEHARFFLRNKRYAKALAVKNDAEAFAREIHKAGYATGPTYADDLVSLMRRHNLRRFDLTHY